MFRFKLNKCKHKVYRITFPSGRIYIGYTGNSINKRITEHKTLARKKHLGLIAGSVYPISRAFWKYKNAYKVEILATFKNKQDAFDFEIQAISKAKSQVKGTGLNVSSGGRIAPEGFGGNYWKIGKTEQQIKDIYKKMGTGSKNRIYKVSEETKFKMVATRRLNGTYVNNGPAIKVVYKGTSYGSKEECKRVNKLGRKTFDRLFKERVITCQQH